MPNNIDMGGFGSPGLPVRAGISGALFVETTHSPITPVKVNMVSAGAGASFLQEWQVGSVSVLSVSKSNGKLTFNNLSNQSYIGSIDPVGGLGGVGFYFSTAPASFADFAINAGNTCVVIGKGASLGFTSAAANTTAGDLILARDAANILNQRNGTTAQTFRVTRSYADGSNYSWLTHKWNTTTAVIHAEGLGTGSDGSVAFNDAALATNATVGFLMIPSCAGTPSGVPADIPTGQIPMVWDSTNLKLYVYTGGAWKASAAFT